MTPPEVLDADVIEGVGSEVGALVPAGGTPIAVIPSVGAGDLVNRLEVIKTAAQDAMTQDVDYGKVPGTDKDCLFKPGAEKLSVLFQLDVQIDNQKEWGPGDHLTVVSKATAFHAPSGTRLGYGEGICSTREKKYAYRAAKRKCPNCGEEAVIKGKKEFGGGWLCWNKPDKDMNGCGSKWGDGDVSIENQVVGQIDNPDLPDMWNTVVKMAEKRARVDVVLAVTGASALFTQDIEDQVEPAGSQEAPPVAAQPPQQQSAPAPAQNTPPPATNGSNGNGGERPDQKLQRLIQRFGIPEDSVELIRAFVSDKGQLDPGKVELAIQCLEKQDVPKLLRLVGAS